MSQTRNSQRREIAKVFVLAAALIALLTLRVVPIMIEAWEADGFVWNTATALTTDRGLPIGLVVSVPAGLSLGWILLFALDESKKAQSVVIPVSAVFFAVVIWSRGLWFGDTVNWSKNFLPLGVSFVVSLATGGGIEYLGHSRRKFERAGWLLYLSVTATSLVALIQLGVKGMMAPPEAALEVGSTAVFLFLLSVFIDHESTRNVSVVATDNRARTSVIGGIGKTIRDDDLNHVFRGEGAEKIIHGFDIFDEDKRKLPEVSGKILFRYKDTNSLISKWVSVRAENIDTNYVERQMNFNKPVHGNSRLRKAIRHGSKPVRVLLPPVVRNYLNREKSGSLSRRLDTSDIVVLAVSFSDLVSERPEDQDSIETVGALLRRYSDTDTETMLVVTEAEKLQEQYRDDRGETPDLKEDRKKIEDYVNMELLDGYHADVLAVSVEKYKNHSERDSRWKGGMRLLLDRMSG